MYTVYDCLCTCTEYRYSGIIYTIHIYIHIGHYIHGISSVIYYNIYIIYYYIVIINYIYMEYMSSSILLHGEFTADQTGMHI